MASQKGRWEFPIKNEELRVEVVSGSFDHKADGQEEPSYFLLLFGIMFFLFIDGIHVPIISVAFYLDDITQRYIV
jgi:hypothetical protein